MTINGIRNDALYYQTKKSGKTYRSNEQEFCENLSYSLFNAEDNEDNSSQSTIRSSAIGNSFSYRSMSALALHMNESEESNAVTECEVRNIKYKDSSYVKISILEGYTYKTQVNTEEDSVYVEKKSDDGTVKGYEVVISEIAEESDNAIEQIALQAWAVEEEKALLEQAETEDIQNVETALNELYDFIKKRIKDGPEKYQMGASELSLEDWDKLLEDVDDSLDGEKPDIEEALQTLLRDRVKEGRMRVPYAHLVKDGVITYNGVVFNCNEKWNAICLGDVSNRSDCLTIPLEKGGCLIVNKDNLGDLSNAIGMFSPEDINRILRAIEQEKKAQSVQNEIEENTSKIWS